METERCTMTNLQESDFRAVKTIYANEDVRMFLGGIVIEEKILRENFFDRLVCTDTDSLCWVIRSKQYDEFIGLVSLDKHHEGINTEISYQLLPKWWGKGYATEVISEIIKYAFQNLGLPKLIAETQTANKSSCRLIVF
jgi:ribosomal-protein-alanine N-acetyltransferase